MHCFTPSIAEFRELAKQGNLVPVFAELIADAETPVGAFAKLDDGGYTFLFESVEKSEQTGRYSILVVGARTIIESNGRTMRITEDVNSPLHPRLQRTLGLTLYAGPFCQFVSVVLRIQSAQSRRLVFANIVRLMKAEHCRKFVRRRDFVRDQ